MSKKQYKQTDTQTDREKDRQTDTHTQAVRQTDRQTHVSSFEDHSSLTVSVEVILNLIKNLWTIGDQIPDMGGRSVHDGTDVLIIRISVSS